MPVISACPARSLRDAVNTTVEISAEALETDSISRKKLLVVQPLGLDDVSQCQHQRGVGAGLDREPLDSAACLEIGADRRDVDELHAVRGHARDRAGHHMLGSATGRYLCVLHRQAAERNEQLAMLFEVRPGGGVLLEDLHRRQDVRGQRPARAEAVSVDVTDVAADRVEEAVNLALGVMKAPGARPAIGTAEDRAVAEIFSHTGKFGGDDVERLIPRHLDELVATTPVPRVHTLTQKTLADRRPPHARRRGDAVDHAGADRRRRRIEFRGVHCDHAAIPHARLVDAPVRRHVTICRHEQSYLRPG